MPYADPDKRAEAARIRAKKSKLNKKMQKLQGRLDDRATTGKESAAVDASPPPTDVPSLKEWARRKVQIGQSWVKRSEELLARNPVSAFQIGRAGVDLVNANLALLQAEVSGPEQGSVEAVDKRFLMDPEFLELAEQMLARKAVLQGILDTAESG